MSSDSSDASDFSDLSEYEKRQLKKQADNINKEAEYLYDQWVNDIKERKKNIEKRERLPSNEKKPFYVPTEVSIDKTKMKKNFIYIVIPNFKAPINREFLGRFMGYGACSEPCARFIVSHSRSMITMPLHDIHAIKAYDMRLFMNKDTQQKRFNDSIIMNNIMEYVLEPRRDSPRTRSRSRSRVSQ
jgi:hypothetical protein